MGRAILFVFIAAVIAGLWARSAFAEKRRQKEEPPEVNKHPERFEESLDPTDDA
jgi:hypothetical protein